MVVSTVVGVFALVVWALTSSTSRFAVRYALEAMYLVEPDEDARYYEPIASYHQADAPDLPAEQEGQSPRWVLALTAFQSGGLVLGMLMVMVGSIP